MSEDDVKNTIFNFEDLVKEFEDTISKAEKDPNLDETEKEFVRRIKLNYETRHIGEAMSEDVNRKLNDIIFLADKVIDDLMIEDFKIGDMVQVGFGKTEKMLVKITKICGDRFEAKVEWLPRESPIKVGDGVMFSRNDILGSSIEIQQEKP